MKITATFKVTMLYALSEAQGKTKGLPYVHSLHANYFLGGGPFDSQILHYGRAIDHYIGPM